MLMGAIAFIGVAAFRWADIAKAAAGTIVIRLTFPNILPVLIAVWAVVIIDKHCGAINYV